MSQNYSNIIASEVQGNYQKLYEDYRDKYREAASEAKEAETEAKDLSDAISDFCTNHDTITDNGTYTINEGNSFEVSVASYDTVTMTVTGDDIKGVPLPTVNNGNFFIYDQFAVGDHQVVICQTGLLSGYNISSVSGDASIDHGTLSIYGDFTVIGSTQTE